MGGVEGANTPGVTPDPDLTRRILEALAGLRFGSVEIVVHDSQVVQIERREKVRLAPTTVKGPGPGSTGSR